MSEASAQLMTDLRPLHRSDSSPLLEEMLDALRRRHVAVAVFTGLAMSIVVGLELLALAMFLDWWIELPWGIRLASLVAQTGLMGTLLFRLVLRPILQQPDEDELAL